jgi:hypothetical protein
VGYNGTKYFAIPGIAFDAGAPHSDAVGKAAGGYLTAGASGITFTAAVILPQGAKVTKAIVRGVYYGTAPVWSLKRIKISDATGDTMAIGDLNVEDTSIDYDTVDNSTYAYLFSVTGVNVNDQIYGARIEYTI